MSTLSYETIKQYINNKNTGGGCNLVTNEEEYNNLIQFNTASKITLSIKCKCGSDFNNTFSNFKSKQSKKMCKKCVKENRKIITMSKYDKIKKYIEIDSGSGCRLLSKVYTGDRDLLLIECKCGNPFNTSMKHFRGDKLRRQRQCEECSKRNQKEKVSFSYEQVKHFIEVESNSGCKLLSSVYVNSDELLKLKCSCGNEFECNLSNFKFYKKYNCNECSSLSINSDKIKNILDELMISYTREFSIENCKNIRSLKFDFAIFENKEKTKLKCLIEYDGEQHFKAIDYFGGEERLEKQKINDSIKNDFCKNNNINLLRIPYWEQGNIEKIINSYIKELNL